MNNRIFLPHLASRLRPVFGEDTPKYRALWFMMHDGVFSMQSEPGKRGYFAFESDLPAITEAVRQAVSTKRRQKVAA